jgi:DNA-binding transcriptional regulator YiaG
MIDDDKSLQNDQNHKLPNRKLFAERFKLVVDSYESASALARAMGVVEGTIRKWAEGKSEPKVGDIAALSVLEPHINLTWLLTGKGAMHTTQALEATETIDTDLLAKALEIVDSVGAKLPLERKAKVATALYALFAKKGGHWTRTRSGWSWNR